MPPKKKATSTSGRQAKLAFTGGKLSTKEINKSAPTSDDEFNGDDQTDTETVAEGKQRQ
jgi:hypothetical protein